MKAKPVKKKYCPRCDKYTSQWKQQGDVCDPCTRTLRGRMQGYGG